MSSPVIIRGESLQAEEIVVLHELLRKMGEAPLARAIGISRQGLARALASLSLYGATRKAIGAYLRGYR